MLRGSLTCLADQKFNPALQWEVVVVDNNCTDDTRTVVLRALDGFSVPLRCVEEPKQGLSNARNRGIAEARGRYLLFTDDDTRPETGWVQTLWDTFQKYNCDAVGGRVEILWPAARPLWFADELISSLAGVDYGDQEIALSYDRRPLGANMAFQRSVFERIGNFDPELGRIGAKLLGGEETELFRRLCEAGMTGIYQPRAVVRHLIEPDRVRKKYFRKIYFYGGRSEGKSYATTPARRIGGVPFFAVRQFGEKLTSLVRSSWNEGPAESFMKELQAWWLLGFMTGCSSARSVSRS